MTAPAFTPGPWRTIKGDSVIRIVGRTAVAVTDSKPYYAPFDETDRANARLIAAAPELYEALIDDLDTLDKLRKDLAAEDAELHAQRIAVFELQIERIENSLRKARGEP